MIVQTNTYKRSNQRRIEQLRSRMRWHSNTVTLPVSICMYTYIALHYELISYKRIQKHNLLQVLPNRLIRKNHLWI